MAKTKAKRGRAPKGEYAGKTSVVSFRFTPATKAALKKAAAISGRSVSQEAEYRLHRSLSASPTQALMGLVSDAIDGLKNLDRPNATWTDDPYLFVMALQAASTALELFRPAEPMSPEASEMLGSRQGMFALFSTLRDVQLADYAPDTPYGRALRTANHALGPFLNSMHIWGMDALTARNQHERSQHIRAELIPLSKKEGTAPEAMTQQETKRLWELRSQLAAIAGGRQ
jgi:hypothetical protein